MIKKIFVLFAAMIVSISVFAACDSYTETPVSTPAQESQPATTRQDVSAKPTEATQEGGIEGYFWGYMGGDHIPEAQFMRFEDGLVYMYDEDVELIDTFKYTLSSTRLTINNESFGVEFDSYEGIDYLSITDSDGYVMDYANLGTP